ncbi:G-type lectin S-receptor-like serine/threonine-protein kinase SD2-5 [Ancistrocladus abbreviatus]
MGTRGYTRLMGFISLFVLLQSQTCIAGVQVVGTMTPGFQGSQMNYIDKEGQFLLSNDSKFALEFKPTQQDVTLFLLVIVHLDSSTVIWTANRGSPVDNSDNFVFSNQGNVILQHGAKVIWSPDTGGRPVSAIQLEDSGNLVLLGNDNSAVWQSFSHPTDTLISNQDFTEGMRLSSSSRDGNLSYFLEIQSGDMVLYAGFQTPQPYWTMGKDSRKVINKDGGVVSAASLDGNSWKFYDKSRALLWQFIFSSDTTLNSTWIAVLGTDGSITFNSLGSGGSNTPAPTKIPSGPCGTPEHCGAYYACSSDRCQCPPGLLSDEGCGTGIVSTCGGSKDPIELVYAGNGLSYFALGYVQPSAKTDLNGCKASCAGNCSCIALFYDNSSRSCFLFDRIGSFLSDSTSDIASYVKVSSSGSSVAGGSGGSNKHFLIVLIIAIVTVLLIVGMLYGGYRYYLRKKRVPPSPHETSEEDNFLGPLSGMPVRYSYKDLQAATNDFSEKLGQGGFGSVYKGVLPDGTRLAVKKLEGVGQGKKEFRAEVSIIGSIHHVHLVRLKGFCAEGSHRLLAYEYMANGSLDKWIFKRNNEGSALGWETRFNIALGTAKGLAYLHEDCDVKIIHCDIKPENVLLDDNFQAKVSDFGLAKLMNREQSHVFTTLRGTRGYLAPEWITNYAISEKSDVYSYGMVLLEIIGGRKNYDPLLSPEKSHFPSYAFKMMEEGNIKEIVDSYLKHDPYDESVCAAIRVALWCIQEDMSLRPPMTRVVQMLEGLCPVPQPPTSSVMGSRLYSSFFKSISEEGTTTGTSSGPSDCNSDTHQSAVRLSGPR